MATAAEEGYDVELLQEVSSDLYCVICLKLMRNPVQFKCGHGMCYGCFRNLLQKARQKNGETQCPQCREIVRDNQAISNVMLHRLILSMRVQCSNECHGCMWIGTLSELDDHLLVCRKNVQRKKSPKKQQQNQQKQQQKKELGLVPDTVHGNLLVSIVDSLTSLHDKVDDIESKLLYNTPITRNGSVTPNSNMDDGVKQEVEALKRRRTVSAALSTSSTTTTTTAATSTVTAAAATTAAAKLSNVFTRAFQGVCQTHSDADLAKFIGFSLIVLLLLIYFVTAMAFSSFERLPVVTNSNNNNNKNKNIVNSNDNFNSVDNTTTECQPDNSEMSAKCRDRHGKDSDDDNDENDGSSCGGGDFEISEKLDGLLSRIDAQFESFFEVVTHGMKSHVFEMQMTERQVLEEIPDFYVLQNRTVSELEKRFAYSMEQSRVQINTNISHYDTRSLNTLSVDNVQSLVAMAQPIFDTLSKRIFEDINFAEFHAFRAAENVYKTVRTNLWSIRQKAEFGSQAVFPEDNLYASQLSWYSEILAELRDNVTRSYKFVDKDKFLTAVAHDFLSLKLKYQHTLNSYHGNITRVLTQEQRFSNLMQRVENVDLRNGRFVWKLNATKIASARNADVFKSRRFQTGSTGRGMLFLYNDKTRPGYFKLTFVQFKAQPALTIFLSVMSQIRPEVLLCFDTPIGISPRKTKAEVVKHFTVPMNMTELKQKGFVKDNTMFVRCLTEDKRIQL